MTAPPPLIVAHRGFSGREPEQTTAAYRAAIEWSAGTGVPVILECDVQFSADDQIVCLHDLTVDRTSDAAGPAFDFTLDELRRLDFGSWRVRDPSPEQRRIPTLPELLIMVREARDRGVDVQLAIETKHPNPRELELEDRLPDLLIPYGWTAAGSPVRLMSFSVPALERMGRLLPELERTLLIEQTLGGWTDGRLPDGVAVAGVDLRLLRGDPGYAGRLFARGGRLNVWTVNRPQDTTFCRELGVHVITTDHPDRVAAALAG